MLLWGVTSHGSWHVYASRFAAALDASPGEAESKHPSQSSRGTRLLLLLLLPPLFLVLLLLVFLLLLLVRERKSPCFKPTLGRSSPHRIGARLRARQPSYQLSSRTSSSYTSSRLIFCCSIEGENIYNFIYILYIVFIIFIFVYMTHARVFTYIF